LRGKEKKLWGEKAISRYVLQGGTIVANRVRRGKIYGATPPGKKKERKTRAENGLRFDGDWGREIGELRCRHKKNSNCRSIGSGKRLGHPEKRGRPLLGQEKISSRAGKGKAAMYLNESVGPDLMRNDERKEELVAYAFGEGSPLSGEKRPIQGKESKA